VEDPVGMEARQRRDQEAAVSEASSRLNGFRRGILKWVLQETHTFLRGRENAKALTIMGLADLKRRVRVLSRKLLEQGMLEAADDIYFLTLPELIDSCRGKEIQDPSLIRRRKQEHERNQNVILPETFTGRPKPMRARETEVQKTKVLKGLPVSPGRVTGPARVILDPRVDASMRAGEILVVPVTDTGWTPLFMMAKGLVVDVGGLLSHGSIVAREYGIPGVLNVLVGTKLIKTGQIITVDGGKGEVYIQEEG
jgi:rifampicin phosphotransferase